MCLSQSVLIVGSDKEARGRDRCADRAEEAAGEAQPRRARRARREGGAADRGERPVVHHGGGRAGGFISFLEKH